MKIIEAEKKWCPYSRGTEQEQDTSWNRLFDEHKLNTIIPKMCLCIHNACMAWFPFNDKEGDCSLMAAELNAAYCPECKKIHQKEMKNDLSERSLI